MTVQPSAPGASKGGAGDEFPPSALALRYMGKMEAVQAPSEDEMDALNDELTGRHSAGLVLTKRCPPQLSRMFR